MEISDWFYTEQQAADILQVNRLTIWRWIKARKLDAQSIGGSKKRVVLLIPKWRIDLIRDKRQRTQAEL